MFDKSLEDSSSKSCYIRQLTLENFRSYDSLSLNVPTKSIILIGKNGAGKTNILEAISLLTAGRGMRSAKSSDIFRKEKDKTNKNWAVSALLDHNGEEVQVGTGVMGNSDNTNSNEKRIVRIDGEKKKSQHALGLYFSCVWLTPQMGQMFLEGNSTKRRFFDRLVYSFDADHASHIYSYEHHMRERNKLLMNPSVDDAWLKIIERKMASYTVIIAVARLHCLEHLLHAMSFCSSAFPVADVKLEGQAELLLSEGLSGSEVEEVIINQLFESRNTDKYRGRASVGAHKTEMQVFFTEKNMEASQCSTGEQKSLLLSILLAHAKARANWNESAPALLLDEVVAHLDQERRKELFAEIVNIGVQAWMTGTDAADFSAAKDMADIIEIDDSRIVYSGFK